MHENNTIATAKNVLNGLLDGVPMTESAVEAMPKLVDLLRSFGRDDATRIADGIEAALAERVA